MEITELNFRYKRIVRDFAEISFDLPVLIFQDGFMDGFLEDYHDAFGFSDYGRHERPRDEFLYEVKRNGKTIVEGKTGIAVGDIRLAVKKPLIAHDAYTLSIRGDIEVPVSDAKKGYSNGSLDSGISLLFDARITERVKAYLNAGYVFAGDVRGHEHLDIDDFVHGGAAIETVLWEKFNVILQLQGQSAIYPATDLLAVDRDAWLLAVGGRYAMESGSFELSLTEDLNTAGAPDFIINLTYKHHM